MTARWWMVLLGVAGCAQGFDPSIAPPAGPGPMLSARDGVDDGPGGGGGDADTGCGDCGGDDDDDTAPPPPPPDPDDPPPLIGGLPDPRGLCYRACLAAYPCEGPLWDLCVEQGECLTSCDQYFYP